MSYDEFLREIEAISYEGNHELSSKILQIINMLNEADDDDTFGTEGWKRIIFE